MKPKERYLAATAVVLSLGASVILALALGELWLRVRPQPSIRLMHDQIILPKNQVYIYSHVNLRGVDSRVVHHKNSLGFRGAEPPARGLAGALSVVAVGGSTTECFYLSDGHSWPELVGEKLKPGFPSLWMNNAGLDGHSTFGHQILMKDVIVPLHPKVVLFLVGINDVGRDDLVISDKEFLKQHRDKTSLQRVLREAGEKSRVIGWIENLIRSFSAWKRGLNHHAYDLKAIPDYPVSIPHADKVLEDHRTKYLKGYQDRLESLMQQCRDADIQPVLITQPALYGKGTDDVTGVNLETIEVKPDMNGRLAWQVLQLYNDQTRALGRRQHIPVIDLARELGKSSNYFYDFYHFTHAGSEAAADIIAQNLRPWLNQKHWSDKLE